MIRKKPWDDREFQWLGLRKRPTGKSHSQNVEPVYSRKLASFAHCAAQRLGSSCILQPKSLSLSAIPASNPYWTGNAAASSSVLNVELTQIVSQLEEEKKKGQAMAEMRRANAVRWSMTNWWERPVEEMNMIQLREMKSALEELWKIVVSETSTARQLGLRM
ncbi:LOW QUALITY PROTEIN: hypothetical protein HID58_062234 [Brassica napus]|uniref:Uncharacterized protein n=1 Tax=Brassica napus TaxID=3708 RepID=A0ABQ8A125_BRANA|nr:LOW QUALITY PROTEIN: hypothetical protein HID58_062234 [Brassica napus]